MPPTLSSRRVRLQVEWLERRTLFAGLSMATATPLPFSPVDTVAGRAIPEREDWYQLDLPAGRLTAELEGPATAGLLLHLASLDGQPLVDSIGSGTAGPRIDQHLTGGRYFLMVTARSETDYQLTTHYGVATAPFDPIPVGKTPGAVASGDFDGDGHTDLVTANAGDSTLSLLLGNGDGTFRPALPVPTGAQSGPDGPVAVVASDLNRDNVLDLVCTNSRSGTLSVLYGHGDGTFAPAERVAVGGKPAAVAVADVDGDGVQELLCADRLNHVVQVVRRDASGRFLPVERYRVGFEPVALAVAEVTGDPYPDLICASYQDRQVTVLVGDGRGGFGAPTPYMVDPGPTALVVADVNGDHRDDVLTANRVGNSVNVLCGKPGGGVDVLPAFAAGQQPVALAVGDIDGDKRPDLVVATEADTLQVFRGDGNGGFSLVEEYAVRGGQRAVLLTDLTGDGRPEMVCATEATNQLVVMYGNGDGSFRARQQFIVGSRPIAVAVADFDLDGRRDVVTANAEDNTLVLLLGNGDGTFQPRRLADTGRSPVAVATRDFNRDGRPDLVVANRGDDTLTVLLGNGAGGFLPAPACAVGREPDAVTTADLNRDGWFDLVVANRRSNTLTVLFGRGDGTFNRPLTLPVGEMPFAVVAANLDGDRWIDLAAVNQESGTVTVYHGLGHGRFGRRQDYSVGLVPVDLAAGDIVGDNRTDLVTANQDGTVTLLRGMPGGRFKRPSPDLNVGGTPSAVLIADADGYGHMAVMVADSTAGTVTVLRRSGQGSRWDRFSVPAGKEPAALVSADLNGDGRPDLVAANSADSTVEVLLGPFLNAASVTHTTLREIAARTQPFSHDFNRDGLLDSVLLDRTGLILFRKGKANPTAPFSAFVPLNVNRPARDMVPVRIGTRRAVAAIDLQPLVTRHHTVHTLSLYGVNAKGNPLGRQKILSTSVLPTGLVAGKLFGSRLDDLVLLNGLDNSVSIVRQKAPGQFVLVATIPVGVCPTAATLADLNGDGLLDLAVSSSVSSDVTVLLNAPTDPFTDVARYRAGGGPFASDASTGPATVLSLNQPVALAAANVTGDEALDLIVLNRGAHAIQVLVNDGHGRFLDPDPTLATQVLKNDDLGRFLDPDPTLATSTTDGLAVNIRPGSMVVDDFDRDKRPDLAILMEDRGEVWVFAGQAGGTFRHTFTLAAGSNPTGLSMAANPTTGHTDLLVGNPFGDALWLRGNGDGTFAPPPPLTGTRSDVAVAPTTSGKAPVLVVNQQTGEVSVQVETTRGVFQTLVTIPPPGGGGRQAPREGVWARLTPGAGRFPDLVVVGTGSNDVLVYPCTGTDANGRPTFGNPQRYLVGTHPVAVVAKDVDGDGDLDLLVTNQGSNDVSVLRGQITGGKWTATAETRIKAGGFDPVGVTLRDANDDGRLDLLVTNSRATATATAGSVTVMPGRGGGYFDDRTPWLVRLQGIPTGPPVQVGPIEVVPTADGRLVGVGLGTLYNGPLGVRAISAVGNHLLAAMSNGTVELLELTAHGFESIAQLQELTDRPEAATALDVLRTESGYLALVASEGSSNLSVFRLDGLVFDAVGIDQRPGAGPGKIAMDAEPAVVEGSPLLVAVTLVAGGLSDDAPLGSGGHLDRADAASRPADLAESEADDADLQPDDQPADRGDAGLKERTPADLDLEGELQRLRLEEPRRVDPFAEPPDTPFEDDADTAGPPATGPTQEPVDPVPDAPAADNIGGAADARLLAAVWDNWCPAAPLMGTPGERYRHESRAWSEADAVVWTGGGRWSDQPIPLLTAVGMAWWVGYACDGKANRSCHPRVLGQRNAPVGSR